MSTCAHCELSVGRRPVHATIDGAAEVFCCYGCVLARQVTRGSGESGAAASALVRLGIARTIARERYTPTRAAAALQDLLDNPTYSRRATEIGTRVQQEDGVGSACDALEAVLGSPHPWSAVATA